MDGRLITAEELTDGLEASLTRLRTDYVDIYHLHGVRTDQYDHAVAELVPAMHKLRDAVKIRFLGITESFASDPGHQMLSRIVRDDCWDVVMVGFNILDQSARNRVLAETRRRGMGVLCMFAVPDALSRPDTLRETIAELIRQELIDREGLDLQDPLGFVHSAAESLPDAAYRSIVANAHPQRLSARRQLPAPASSGALRPTRPQMTDRPDVHAPHQGCADIPAYRWAGGRLPYARGRPRLHQGAGLLVGAGLDAARYRRSVSLRWL